MPQGILNYQQAFQSGQDLGSTWKQLEQKDRALDIEDLRRTAEKSHWEAQIEVAQKAQSQHNKEFAVNEANVNASAAALANKLRLSGHDGLANITEGLRKADGTVNIPALSHFINPEYQSEVMKLSGKDKDLKIEMDRLFSQAMKEALSPTERYRLTTPAVSQAEVDRAESVAFDRDFKPANLGPPMLGSLPLPFIGGWLNDAAKYVSKLYYMTGNPNIKGSLAKLNPEGIMGMANTIEEANQGYGALTKRGAVGGSSTQGVMMNFLESFKSKYQEVLNQVSNNEVAAIPELGILGQAIKHLETTTQQNYYNPEAEDKRATDLEKLVMSLDSRERMPGIQAEAKKKP